MEESKNLEQNLDRSNEKLHLSVVSCSVCGSQDIFHEEKQGRGLPPKSYNPHPLMPKPKISWGGIWDVWTCNKCGETRKKLRK
jgi:hypothetical protein